MVPPLRLRQTPAPLHISTAPPKPCWSANRKWVQTRGTPACTPSGSMRVRSLIDSIRRSKGAKPAGSTILPGLSRFRGSKRVLTSRIAATSSGP